ncbi:hypothetical protein N665_0704s0007, partial [Sinapis alba]
VQRFLVRSILEKDPAKVKGEKLRVCYKTLLNEDGSNPCSESIERCFIRPVPPECLNEGVIFKEGLVVDAYFSDGWWNDVIVVERLDGSFLVYFDDPPDIIRFNRRQLRPYADWTGSKWVKSRNKELSEDMFTGKLVEITRKIGEMEAIWIQALILKEIQVSDKRKFMVKRCSSSQHLSDDTEEITTTVDICKIRLSPPRNLFKNYTLAENVEVFVGYGCRKGVREFEKEANNDVAIPAITPQASHNNTPSVLKTSVLETTEDDMMSDAPTLITTPQETPNNTHEMND